ARSTRRRNRVANDRNHAGGAHPMTPATTMPSGSAPAERTEMATMQLELTAAETARREPRDGGATATFTHRETSSPEPSVPVPELSVVMPCLNEAETLATCIEKAQLALQRFKKIGRAHV